MSEEPNAGEQPAPPGASSAWYGRSDLLGRQRFYVAVGLSLALLAQLLVKAPSPWFAIAFAILLLSSRWWVGLAFVPKIETPPRIGRPVSKLSYVFLLGALILGTSIRLPLMDRHLEDSEYDSLAQRIHGYTEISEDGAEAWRKADRSGTDLFSVSAKSTLAVWRKLTGLSDDRFHVIPMRIPSLLAGLASIILVWRTLHWFGYRCAALFAAFFLAIHPTAIDIHVQASGYSLSMLFQLLAIASSYLALRTLKWRYWVLYGASILLCVDAYPGSIYFAIGVNLFLAFYLVLRIWRSKTRAAARPQFVRLCIVNLIAALVLLQIVEPGPAHQVDRQIADYFIDSDVAKDPLLKFNTFILSPLLLLFGMLKLWRSNRFAAPIALGALGAPVLAYVFWPIAQQSELQSWYLIYFLPIFTLLLAIGITSLSEFYKNKKHRPYITLGIGAAFLIFFSFFTEPTAGNNQEIQKLGELEFTEFQGADSRWRAYKDGKLTRESPKKIDTGTLE